MSRTCEAVWLSPAHQRRDIPRPGPLKIVQVIELHSFPFQAWQGLVQLSHWNQERYTLLLGPRKDSPFADLSPAVVQISPADRCNDRHEQGVRAMACPIGIPGFSRLSRLAGKA